MYVDDIIVAATTTALCKQYVEIIAQKYRCTILGELRLYLNIQIGHDRDSRTIYMCQEMYIDAMVKNFSQVVAENSSVATPMLEI